MNNKVRVNYETIKSCPICGNIPYIEKISMDRGNGRGYPGEYNYCIKCDVCNYPDAQYCDTVYSDSHEEAKATAIKKWNIEVERIKTFLNHKERE